MRLLSLELQASGEVVAAAGNHGGCPWSQFDSQHAALWKGWTLFGDLDVALRSRTCRRVHFPPEGLCKARTFPPQESLLSLEHPLG